MGVVGHQRGGPADQLVRHLDLVCEIELLELIDELVDVTDLLPARVARFAQGGPASFKLTDLHAGLLDHWTTTLATSYPCNNFHRMSQHRDGQEARFPALRLTRVARTRSTQDIVLRAARGGADEGFCCIAAEQTAGRGRQGRVWVAAAGTALLASVLVRRFPRVASGIPFAAGLALVDVLADRHGVTAGRKWPNDVLVEGRKLAGILCEVERPRTGQDRVAVVLGLGVNLTVDRFPDGIAAVSLHALVDRPPTAEELLVAWGRAFAERIAALERGGLAAVLPDWRRCALGLGEQVTVHGPSGVVKGVAVGVGDDGALLVEASGQLERFLAGDVHLTPDTG